MNVHVCSLSRVLGHPRGRQGHVSPMPMPPHRGGTPLLDRTNIDVYPIIGMGETCCTWLGAGYYLHLTIAPLFTYCCLRCECESALALFIFDQQYRLDSPPPSHPLYYWTNSYSWLQDAGTDPDPDILNDVAQAMRYMIPRRVTMVEWRVVTPSGAVVWPLGSIETGGIAPFTDAPGLRQLCLLVDFFREGRRVGYKRYRGPWPDSLVDGATWSPDLVDWFSDGALPNLMIAPVCSRSGELFDSYRVRPEIHGWQVRPLQAFASD